MWAAPFPNIPQGITAPRWGRLAQEPAERLISKFKSTCSFLLISSNNINPELITLKVFRISPTFSS